MRQAYCAALLWLLISSSANADVFAIAKPQFSIGISDDGNYTAIDPASNGTISRKALEQGKLYFSVTLLGEENAIQYLQHKLRLDAYAVIFADGIRRDTVQFGITQQRWSVVSQALLNKFDADGFFTFRTFMCTQQTQYSSIEILIRDGLDNTIGRLAINIVP